MKIKHPFWLATAVIAFAILLLIGFAFFISYQDGELTYFGLNSSLKSIAAIPDSGISLDNFRHRMGLAARHQFTVKRPDGIYTLVICFFRGDSDNLWYLFRDKSLVKVVRRFVHVRVFNVKSEDTLAIDDADTVRSIDAIIGGEPATHEDVLDKLKPPPQYQSDNELPAWLVIPLSAIAAVHVVPDVLTTRRSLGRYSGFKVELGMNEGDVRRLYGKPSGAFHLRQGEIVYMYYDQGEHNSYVASQLTFHGTAVVMSPNGIVTECLGDGFFNENWIK